MSKQLTTKSNANQEAIEKALIMGDLASLNVDQRLSYVKMVCKSVKLNPLTKPFSYIKFDGITQLYINRGGTEQLRMIHKVSTKIVSREISKERELYTVVARAVDPKGREEEAIGVVSIQGLRGKELANAFMRAETKAKRRATLALCGLSQFDSPTGDDEPIKETKSQERIEEVTQQAQVEGGEAVETVTEVVVEETEIKAPTDGLPPASADAPPQPQDYIMRAGKNKGKALKDMPESKLKRWMEWYSTAKEAGKELHADVQEDAFYVHARLLELKIEKDQIELKELKNGEE